MAAVQDIKHVRNRSTKKIAAILYKSLDTVSFCYDLDKLKSNQLLHVLGIPFTWW